MNYQRSTYRIWGLLLIVAVCVKSSTAKKNVQPLEVAIKNGTTERKSIKSLLNRNTIKQMDLKDTEKLMAELVNDIANTFSEDTSYAMQQVKENPGLLSSDEASTFVDTIAVQALLKIKDDMELLSSLTNNKEETARAIAEKIFEATQNKTQQAQKPVPVSKELLEGAKTFILEALTNV